MKSTLSGMVYLFPFIIYVPLSSSSPVPDIVRSSDQIFFVYACPSPMVVAAGIRHTLIDSLVTLKSSSGLVIFLIAVKLRRDTIRVTLTGSSVILTLLIVTVAFFPSLRDST